MSKKEFIITAIIALLSVALIVVVIVSKKNDAKNNPTTPSSSVAHDHDGDGVPDHDDSYHATSGGEEDLDIGVDIDELPTESGSTGNSTGNSTNSNSGAVSGGEIEFDDLYNKGNGSN